MPSAFLEEPVAKGAVGDALVRLKAKRAEKKAAKPKKVNFALRPLKGMSVMMGVAKGAYSESMEGIQRDRQKANRRRSAGNAFLGGAVITGAAAAANPEATKDIVARGGKKVTSHGNAMVSRADRELLRTGLISGKNHKMWRAGKKLVRVGTAVSGSPGKAAAGIVGGAALAGAGLKGAGMAHNARSNKNARKYNRRKANSRIKIVPVSGKNRF